MILVYHCQGVYPQSLLTGGFHCHTKRQGSVTDEFLHVQGAGLVVNICSVSSYLDLPLSAVYCASKAALLSLTNCLRMEVQPLGVHVMGR